MVISPWGIASLISVALTPLPSLITVIVSPSEIPTTLPVHGVSELAIDINAHVKMVGAIKLYFINLM